MDKKEIEEIIEDLKYLQDMITYNISAKNRIESIIEKINNYGRI